MTSNDWEQVADLVEQVAADERTNINVVVAFQRLACRMREKAAETRRWECVRVGDGVGLDDG